MKYEFVSLYNPILLPDNIRQFPEGFDWAWADGEHWFAFTCEAADEEEAKEEVELHFPSWCDRQFADEWAESLDKEWEDRQSNPVSSPPIKGGDLPFEDYIWLKVGESLLGEEFIK